MDSGGFQSYIKHLFKALVLSYILTLILILIMSLLLTYTSLKESNIPLLNTITMIVSISIGSIYIAIKIQEKGWLNGGILGVLYFLVLILLNFLFVKPFTLDVFSITKFLIALATGIIGGVLGINLK